MSLRYALDTSIVSVPFWPHPPQALLKRLDIKSHECALPTPVWHELRFGAERLPLSRRRSALERYLSDVVLASFPLLSYDRAAAAWHASQRARLERRGEPPSFVDGMIAAIAAVNELVLITANVGDFARFTRLHIENWLTD